MKQGEHNSVSSTLFSADNTQPRHDMHNRWPRAESVDDFRNNLQAVRQRIQNACLRSGRVASDVRLLPVSKTMDEAHIRLACQAGCDFLGENKVQEAWLKSQAMSDHTDLKWSVIGHLQTNKAKLVAKFASEFQALDSLHTAEALDRRLQAEGRALDVFIQINTSHESSKYGLHPDDAEVFLQQLAPFSSLRVKGLMTLAEFTQDAARVRACFIRLRTLRDRLCDRAPAGIIPSQLSMGMSGDFEIAIEEGATVVRVGQSIFGARNLSDDHFWPAQ